MVHGPVAKGHVDCFKNNLAGSSWWLDHIILWSVEVQTAAIRDHASLCRKNILPVTRNPTFVDSIFKTSQSITT
jgi:hypothetical protein